MQPVSLPRTLLAGPRGTKLPRCITRCQQQHHRRYTSQLATTDSTRSSMCKSARCTTTHPPSVIPPHSDPVPPPHCTRHTHTQVFNGIQNLPGGRQGQATLCPNLTTAAIHATPTHAGRQPAWDPTKTSMVGVATSSPPTWLCAHPIQAATRVGCFRCLTPELL